MNRGDRREPIFKDDFDRRRFLETLGEACAKTSWQVQARPLLAIRLVRSLAPPSLSTDEPVKAAAV